MYVYACCSPKLRKNVSDNISLVEHNMKLVSLRDDVPLHSPLPMLHRKAPPSHAELHKWLQDNEMKSVLRQLSRTGDPWMRVSPATAVGTAEDVTSRDAVRIVVTHDRLQWWINQIRQIGVCSFHVVQESIPSGRRPMGGASLPIGISLCIADPYRVCYIPFGHSPSSLVRSSSLPWNERTLSDMVGEHKVVEPRLLEGQADDESCLFDPIMPNVPLRGSGSCVMVPTECVMLPMEDVAHALRDIFRSPDVQKVTHVAKEQIKALHRIGMEVDACDDVGVMSYSIDSGRWEHDLETLNSVHLQRNCLRVKDILGTGGNADCLENADCDHVALYAGQRAVAIAGVYEKLVKRFDEEGEARQVVRVKSASRSAARARSEKEAAGQTPDYPVRIVPKSRVGKTSDEGHSYRVLPGPPGKVGESRNDRTPGLSTKPMYPPRNVPPETLRYCTPANRAMWPAYVRGCRVNDVYFELERPMIGVLTDMERHGVYVNKDILLDFDAQLQMQIREAEDAVYAEAGEPFLIHSPKQLGQVLMKAVKAKYQDKRRVRGKKGVGNSNPLDYMQVSAKSGNVVVDKKALHKLSEDGLGMARDVLTYRELTKMRSTYVLGMLDLLVPETSRIHSHFMNTVTTTGRLSCTEPNLQNIPARSKMADVIRTAFCATPNHALVGADYSQVELRILAHLAGIDSLKTAFRDGVDVHTLTASQVFDVPVDKVDKAIRQRAKAINFGLIYGMSSHGLAGQIGVSRSEATGYVEQYFAQYPGIMNYMECMKSFCQAHGYVTTLFGRKCWLPHIYSSESSVRGNAERAAINTPIQGTSADITKVAMVLVSRALKERGLRARLIMQVHDELIVECPTSELEEVRALLEQTMVQAAEHMPEKIDVPLTVETHVGQNLLDLK